MVMLLSFLLAECCYLHSIEVPSNVSEVKDFQTAVIIIIIVGLTYVNVYPELFFSVME